MRKLLNRELNRLDIKGFKDASKSPIVVVLDNIRSSNNIGSILRTSDAFRIASIYLCGISATPPNKEIHKTALGAEDSVDWKYMKNTIDAVAELKGKGYKIIAIEQVEDSIYLPHYTPDPNDRLALIFGNEVKGVEQDVVNLCDSCLEIPQFGTKHSFNVSVSAGIVLWDIFNKITH